MDGWMNWIEKQFLTTESIYSSNLKPESNITQEREALKASQKLLAVKELL